MVPFHRILKCRNRKLSLPTKQRHMHLHLPSMVAMEMSTKRWVKFSSIRQSIPLNMYWVQFRTLLPICVCGLCPWLMPVRFTYAIVSIFVSISFLCFQIWSAFFFTINGLIHRIIWSVVEYGSSKGFQIEWVWIRKSYSWRHLNVCHFCCLGRFVFISLDWISLLLLVKKNSLTPFTQSQIAKHNSSNQFTKSAVFLVIELKCWNWNFKQCNQLFSRIYQNAFDTVAKPNLAPNGATNHRNFVVKVFRFS